MFTKCYQKSRSNRKRKKVTTKVPITTYLLNEVTTSLTNDNIIIENNVNNETNSTNKFIFVYDSDDSSNLSAPIFVSPVTRSTIRRSMYESPENALGRLNIIDGDGQCHRLGIVNGQMGSMLGLCAIGDMKAELFLGRYIGVKITSRTELSRRMKIPGGCYIADLEEGKSWIDAKDEGNVLRFMNHHCTAFNCQLRMFEEADGSISLGIWTIKFINDKEGLFFDYGSEFTSHIGDPISCLCAGIDLMSGLPICNKKL